MEYVNELANVKPANIIPDFVTSVDEATLYVAEANERNLNDMAKKMNIIESRYYQSTGRHIITEDGNKDGTFAKIKKFLSEKISKLWSFIQAAWTKVVQTIKDVCTGLVTKIKSTFGNTDAVKKQLMAYQGDKTQVVGKLHDFSGIDDLMKLSESINVAINDAYAWQGRIATATDKEGAKAAAVKSDETKVYSKALAPIIKDGKDKLIEKTEGKENDVTIAKLQNIFDECVSYGSDFNVNMKFSKAAFNVAKKQCQNIQKNISKIKDVNTKAITAYIGQISTALTIITNVSTKASYDRNREYAKLVLAARKINLTAKKPKESGKAVGESATLDLNVLFAE